MSARKEAAPRQAAATTHVSSPPYHTARDAAMAYAEAGWRVLPVWGVRDGGTCRCRGGARCSSPGKHPRTPDGVRAASADVKRIATWRLDARANIAIATGAESGLVVVDVDPRSGGDETLAALERRLGPLPATPRVDTGGGGWHIYVAHPGHAVRGTLGGGIDIKSDGGYVVAPPSGHASGGAYTWHPGLTPMDVPLAELPAEWRLALFSDRKKPGQPGVCYTDSARPLRLHRTTQTPQDTLVPPGRQSGLGEMLRAPPDDYTAWAIAQTLPRERGQRHSAIFGFARLIAARPDIAQRDTMALYRLAVRWHEAAVAHLGAGAIAASAAETAEDFLEGLGHVRTPGMALPELAAALARDAPVPAAAADLDDTAQRVAALCREMQRLSRDGDPWYLATRTLARLVPGVGSAMGASRVLRLLERLGILRCVQRGTVHGRQATVWRYVPPLED